MSEVLCTYVGAVKRINYSFCLLQAVAFAPHFSKLKAPMYVTGSEEVSGYHFSEMGNESVVCSCCCVCVCACVQCLVIWLCVDVWVTVTCKYM